MLLFHPKVSKLSCDDCTRFLTVDFEIVRRPAFTGNPEPRPVMKGGQLYPTPCHKCPKIPKDSPKERKYAYEISSKNLQAYFHYLECRAVGSFPEDPIVRRNATIIRGVQDEWDRQPMEQAALVLSLLQTK